MILMAMRMVLIFACRIFWQLGTLFNIWVLLLGPGLAVLRSIWPPKFLVGGMKDPLCICIFVGGI